MDAREGVLSMGSLNKKMPAIRAGVRVRVGVKVRVRVRVGVRVSCP